MIFECGPYQLKHTLIVLWWVIKNFQAYRELMMPFEFWKLPFSISWISWGKPFAYYSLLIWSVIDSRQSFWQMQPHEFEEKFLNFLNRHQLQQQVEGSQITSIKSDASISWRCARSIISRCIFDWGPDHSTLNIHGFTRNHLHSLRSKDFCYDGTLFLQVISYEEVHLQTCNF